MSVVFLIRNIYNRLSSSSGDVEVLITYPFTQGKLLVQKMLTDWLQVGGYRQSSKYQQ